MRGDISQSTEILLPNKSGIELVWRQYAKQRCQVYPWDLLRRGGVLCQEIGEIILVSAVDDPTESHL